ncbi:MAG TPA: hypothetical protein VJY36_05365 [Candidatus Bathyarchaeia archaeon]|nr:hypothetical protein [Candidatus Bathyarchaeia archaeon]
MTTWLVAKTAVTILPSLKGKNENEMFCVALYSCDKCGLKFKVAY